MKRILMIGTGGTIASQISGDALSPQLRPDELLALVPAISKLCEVECVSLFNVDSTSMTPAHWVQITKCVRDNYDKYDGFVISHGTDTGEAPRLHGERRADLRQHHRPRHPFDDG